jgi:hypothetical protein
MVQQSLESRFCEFHLLPLNLDLALMFSAFNIEIESCKTWLNRFSKGSLRRY